VQELRGHLRDSGQHGSSEFRNRYSRRLWVPVSGLRAGGELQHSGSFLFRFPRPARLAAGLKPRHPATPPDDPVIPWRPPQPERQLYRFVEFPSLTGRRLLGILKREPLRYEVVRQVGSHRWLRSGSGYPALLFSWHDRANISGWVVKMVLVKKVGLSEEQALNLVRGGR
jgi:hypothetical protein